MIADFEPYPEYRDSGVPWLGDFPEHWDVRRNKLVLREVDERSEDGSEELLSVSQYTGVTPRRDRQAGGGGLLTNAASLVGYKRVMPGDLVINIMLAWNGSLGVSPVEGIVSTAYCVFRATAAIESRFLHYLFRTPLFTGVFKTVSTGVVDSRLRLYPDVFFRLPTPLPPLDEQAAIVRFLDHADRRIRRYIAAKKKLIALLNEQKQAIIHRAVTRGLDPDVPLKPSGVEWLGAMPEHWEVRRAKAVCLSIIDCKNRTPTFVEDGPYLVVRTTCVRDGHFDPGGGYTTDEANYWTWTARGAPRSGDVFFTREAPAGEACLVPDRDDLCMGQRMMYFRPDPSLLDPGFLLLNIYGPLSKTYVELATNGSTVGHLRLGQVFALPLVWCPIEEQRAILEYVQRATAGLDRTRVAASHEIALVREYRTRLIADVVTGKLDVRKASALLSAEVEWPELLDGANPLFDVEDDVENADDSLDTAPDQTDA